MPSTQNLNSNLWSKHWKSVSLNRSNMTANGVSSFQTSISSFSSVSWYNQMMKSPAQRIESLRRYDMMDRTVNISRALDIMAEDISSQNIENESTFVLKYPTKEDIQLNVLKTMTITKNRWEQRTEFDTRFFDHIREMLKYGAVFFRINKDFSLTKLVAQKIQGYMVDNIDNSRVIAYLYQNDGHIHKTSSDLAQAGTVVNMAMGRDMDKMEIIPISDLMVLKTGEGPFGVSILDRIYRTWRHIQLIEDAVIIYRIVRAPERRIFYIDTGRLPAHKAEARVESIMRKMRQRRIARDNHIDSEYNAEMTTEDYFLATDADGRSSKVETLPGGQNLDQIKDLIYFNKKLALGLRIPMSYLVSALDDNAGNGATYNDGRVGTAYMEELRYAGSILRMQKKIAKPISKHFMDFARHLQVVIPDGVSLKISEPQSFALYRENDLYSSLLSTANSAEALQTISKKLILSKFLHFDKETIEDNERKVLIERGFNQQEIKALTPEQIDQVVYGASDNATSVKAAVDAQLAADAALKAKEDAAKLKAEQAAAKPQVKAPPKPQQKVAPKPANQK